MKEHFKKIADEYAKTFDDEFQEFASEDFLAGINFALYWVKRNYMNYNKSRVEITKNAEFFQFRETAKQFYEELIKEVNRQYEKEEEGIS